MDFWLLIIVTTTLVAVVFVLLSGIARNRIVGFAGHDREFYKSRISEIEQDEKLGRIDPAEAEIIRTQEARKLLGLQGDKEEESSLGPSAGRNLLIASGIFVPLFSAVFYLATSAYAPSFGLFEPDQGIEGRSVQELLRSAERRLALAPDDANGWKVLAPVYLSLGQADKGVAAFRQAIALTEREPGLLTALGEALVVEQGGQVNTEALELFKEAVGKDPENDLSRYYIGLSNAQNGQPNLAISQWESILEKQADNQQWVAFLRERIASVKQGTELSRMPALDQDTVEAMRELDESDRAEMINQMVESLAARLEDNPDDQVGWERLIRSYLVLGRKEEFLKAIESAKNQFPDNAEFLAKLKTIEGEYR